MEFSPKSMGFEFRKFGLIFENPRDLRNFQKNPKNEKKTENEKKTLKV